MFKVNYNNFFSLKVFAMIPLIRLQPIRQSFSVQCQKLCAKEFISNKKSVTVVSINYLPDIGLVDATSKYTATSLVEKRWSQLIPPVPKISCFILFKNNK